MDNNFNKQLTKKNGKLHFFITFFSNDFNDVTLRSRSRRTGF